MGTKMRHRKDTHARTYQQSGDPPRRLTTGHGWRTLIISLSPDKIRALGTFFLCAAMALRILATPLCGTHQSSSIRHWEEIMIVTGLCSAIIRRRTRLKVWWQHKVMALPEVFSFAAINMVEWRHAYDCRHSGSSLSAPENARRQRRPTGQGINPSRRRVDPQEGPAQVSEKDKASSYTVQAAGDARARQ